MIHIKRLLYFLCSSCRPNQSRTVRYAFPLTFVAVALLGALALQSEESSYIRIVSDNSVVEENEFFTVDVYVGAHTPVNAIDIQIAYPEDQVSIEGIDTGTSVITLWTEDPYAENGTVYLSGGTFRKGFLGEHLVAQINARAKKSGTAKFTTEDTRLLAGDGQGTNITIEDTGYESLILYVGVADENGKLVVEGKAKIGIYTDIDGDGDVDMGDVRAFMSAWRDKTAIFDFNNDGRMTFVDFAIILADSFFK